MHSLYERIPEELERIGRLSRVVFMVEKFVESGAIEADPITIREGVRMNDKKQISINEYLEELNRTGEPDRIIEGPSSPPEELSRALEELRAALQPRGSSSPIRISGILLTSYILPGYRFGELEGRKYLLINRYTFESWLRPSFVDMDKISRAVIRSLGIKLIDDEKLVFSVILESIKESVRKAVDHE